MANSNLNRLTVLGAGVLGGQIGWHSSFKGKTVVLYDPYPAALEKAKAAQQTYAQIYKAQLGGSDADIAATRARLTYSDDLKAAVADADLVIEAVPEVPEIKTKIYQDMASLLKPHTLVATNSSTLLPRDFAEATGRPDKYCAMHFANLIWALNLVEIMAHPGTSRETLTAVTHFAIEIGQVPIAVQREQNGYLLNSWSVPLLTASVALVGNGVGTPEDVDRTFMQRAPQRPRLERDRDSEHDQRDAAVAQRFRAGQPVPALVDRVQAADEEKQQRHHHPVEVGDALIAERVIGGRGAPGALHADEEQQLIAGVGDRVDRLRQHRTRSGIRRRNELRRCDSGIGAKCKENRAGAIGCHG